MQRALRGVGIGVGVIASLAVLAGCATYVAGDAGRPDFPQALGELRLARQYLADPPAPTAPERQARAQIEAAIELLRGPVEPDRAKPRPPPLVAADAALTPTDQVHFALVHLDAARTLLSRPERDAQRRALRDASISCVARAQDALGRAMEALLR